MGFIGAIIIGLIAGLIASWIMPGGANGCIWNTILGIAGGAVGGWILRLINVSVADVWYWNILVGVIGACILIAIYNAFTKKKETR